MQLWIAFFRQALQPGARSRRGKPTGPFGAVGGSRGMGFRPWDAAAGSGCGSLKQACPDLCCPGAAVVRASSGQVRPPRPLLRHVGGCRRRGLAKMAQQSDGSDYEVRAAVLAGMVTIGCLDALVSLEASREARRAPDRWPRTRDRHSRTADLRALRRLRGRLWRQLALTVRCACAGRSSAGLGQRIRYRSDGLLGLVGPSCSLGPLTIAMIGNCARMSVIEHVAADGGSGWRRLGRTSGSTALWFHG
jgi:hypothetical protein